MSGRTTTVNWGSTGQFPISITNTLSQTTQKGWDYALGVPTSETDPNGIQIDWQYDAFGRRTREDRPDGTYSTWTFNLCTAWSGACYNWDNGYYRIDQSNRDSAGTQLNWVATFHDPFDRMVDRAALNRDGNQVNERWTFDNLGRLSSQSTPARLSAGDSFFYASFTYDLAGRVTQASRPVSDSDPTAQTLTTYYEGLTTRVVDALGKQSQQIANALGHVVRSTDHDGYYQNVDFDAFGNVIRVQDSASATLQTGTYNLRGLRTASSNIDLGGWSYGYNALGEMTSYTDANSKTLTMTYDALSRPLTRVMPEGGGSITSTWTWGTSAGAYEIGRLKSQQISGTGIATYSEAHSFDSLGRPSETQYTENGNTYTVEQTYSTLTGFVDTLTYPTSTSGYRLKLQYDYQHGALWKVKDYNAPSTVFWQANAANARGQVTEQVLGNGLKTVRSFDQVSGWIDYIQSGPGGGTAVQNLSYLWDKMGNLAQRQDNNQGLTENAYYDNLYRLDYTTLNGSTNLDLSYAANGNLQSQSGVGTYTYHGTKIHAVASINTGGGTWSFSYDSNGNMTDRNGTTLAWYASNLPKSITKDSQNSSTFQYTPSGQRWHQDYKVANVTYSHVYVGRLMEKVTQGATVDWKHYIFAEGQAVALYSRKSSGTNTLSYLLRDHQGSVDVITSSAGAVVVRESFNAYGQRRGTAWSGAPAAGDITTINGLTRRGYTDHEMLDSTGLIHMNGRVYDPVIARFVSADPFHDAALGTQAWNRYAYVGNNPLSRVDPSGFEARGHGRRPRSRNTGPGDDLTWLEIAQNSNPWHRTWGNGLGPDGHPMMGATLSFMDFAQNHVLAGFRGATGPVTLPSSMAPLPRGRVDVLSEDNSTCLLCEPEASANEKAPPKRTDASSIPGIGLAICFFDSGIPGGGCSGRQAGRAALSTATALIPVGRILEGAAAAARGANLVVGSGARQGVITVARDTLAGTPNVIGRVQALPFRPGSMSSISFEGLPFTELTPQAFREATRLLGPGGRITGSTGRAADLGAIRSGLEQAGFRDISVQYALGDAAGNYRVIFSGVGP